jgi:hypothetical protein
MLQEDALDRPPFLANTVTAEGREQIERWPEGGREAKRGR